MLFKKSFTKKTVNGVQMGNGTIASRFFKLNVYSFFIDGVLLDTGAKSLEKFFKLYFNALDIEKVMLTHFHEDHTGGVAYLQKKRGLPIFMNETMIEPCRKMADYPLYRQVFWGRRRPFQATPIRDSFESQNATWLVLHTPGHAVDHHAYLNQETGQLFTGDLYCQDRTKVALREESIPDIIASLEKVLSYDFEDVFCCHAGFVKNGRVALNRKLNYLQDLQGKIVKLHEEGKSPREINTILFPKKYPVTFFSGGDWDSLNIVHSILNET
ncbi:MULTISPECIES: MBL fold metallo-hydrolase [Bacillaceae]|uniref:MBL fold metallo-hydrolase n=1 Tax=Evansella alkalicola TaxID=745819 RepID=A0ABS6JXN7_9BACI|nr:MBL fold metallo-hydrolase [Litchfieldia alkalitelluris]MBU9723356.1 MBL fold metallo-hydrolase [Bacillus alkalicola]